MPKNIYNRPFDLITPDGKITEVKLRSPSTVEAFVEIDSISSNFLGFKIDPKLIHFNIKSTLAQLGVNGIGIEYEFLPKLNKALIRVAFTAFNPIGQELLKYLNKGMYVGKLFAADDRRRVRNADYLHRLLGKTDADGHPLLILSDEYKSEEIIEQPEKNRTIVKIPLTPGHWIYSEEVIGLIPTIAKGLRSKTMSFRNFLFLHQKHVDGHRIPPPEGLLLVKSMTMTICTLFAKVAIDELPQGFLHASADVIEPQSETGDIFEFHGSSTEEISHIPLEFYTLEPYREHSFFLDRDLLNSCKENPECLFSAFETAPSETSAVFIVKGKQLLNLTKGDWIQSDLPPSSTLIIPPENRHDKAILDSFIRSQAIYPIATSMQDGYITSQGILLSTHFPTPSLKTLLINEKVTRYLKAIYIKTPSRTYGDFFSHDDRAFLLDLAKSSVDVYWVDFKYKLLLKYVLRGDKNTGMFVPTDRIHEFKNGTFFGIYGSKYITLENTDELKALFRGLLEMRNELDHPLLNPDVSLLISTGGGPGMMSVGNRIASELGILSCGHAVDFTKPHETLDLHEEMNPHIQAKMTYRLEQIFIRQAEFVLDFPIVFEGGYGTDFELILELLRVQVGIRPAAPILLFGSPDYWRKKLSSLFHINRKTGTIKGSEWVSNTLFCVQNHKTALSIYYKYFTNRLHIGKDYPPQDLGFVVVE